MIKNGYLYKESLAKLYTERWYDPHYKWWFSGSAHWELELDSSDENRRHFVSINSKGEIIGHFSYRFDYESRNACNFGMILFDPKYKALFGRDILRHIDTLFNEWNCHSMVWQVIIGNPAEALYDKFIRHYGGRIVGTYKDDACIYGKYYDTKAYQLLHSEYKSDRI